MLNLNLQYAYIIDMWTTKWKLSSHKIWTNKVRLLHYIIPSLVRIIWSNFITKNWFQTAAFKTRFWKPTVKTDRKIDNLCTFLLCLFLIPFVSLDSQSSPPRTLQTRHFFDCSPRSDWWSMYQNLEEKEHTHCLQQAQTLCRWNMTSEKITQIHRVGLSQSALQSALLFI